MAYSPSAPLYGFTFDTSTVTGSPFTGTTGTAVATTSAAPIEIVNSLNASNLAVVARVRAGWTINSPGTHALIPVAITVELSENNGVNWITVGEYALEVSNYQRMTLDFLEHPVVAPFDTGSFIARITMSLSAVAASTTITPHVQLQVRIP